MKKILVVDDTIPLLEEIRDLLQMEGYEVITASNGSDGITKAEATDPDLIITDILMPEIDGFELISKIRAMSNFRKTPIIVLSAQATKEDEEKSKALKADGYLRKPCSADELLSVIENLI
ncbi:MAG: response regulator [Fulvivirga sp.]